MGALGVIGGSGLYRMAGLEACREESVVTPFGEPSDPYIVGRLGAREAVFLSRHGRGHRLLPTEINYRANIYGFKMLGVDRLVSVSAVGSMKEGLEPLDVVLPDQFIDMTRQRSSTFFGGGIVGHVSLADPVCPVLASALARAADGSGATLHRGGTYVCIEGPQFSTRAESRLYRALGVDVIGMTNVQEAKLAREAEICYATAAMVTDYDCWRDEEAAVAVEEIVARLHQNARVAEAILKRLPDTLPAARDCACARALDNAVLTDRDAMPAAARDRLRLLLGRRLD